MTEPNRLFQEEELDSLRAYFLQDWHDIPPKKTAWGTQTDEGWWEVKIKSREDERVYVYFHGRMTKTYPKAVPPLTLIKSQGLSAEHLATCLKLVREEARILVGTEMILILANLVEDYIENNHLPPPKAGEIIPTLMEQMEQREEAQRVAEEESKRAAQAQEEEEEALRQRDLTARIQQTTQQKEATVKKIKEDEESRKRKEILASLGDGEFESREISLAMPLMIPPSTQPYSDWLVFGGRKRVIWTEYTAEPKGQFVKTNMPVMTVQVVDFTNNVYSTVKSAEIDKIIAEIGKMKFLGSDHVAKLWGAERRQTHKGWPRLLIFTEKVEGARLLDILPTGGLDEETCIRYITQILMGIAEIHGRSILQKQLELGSVYLSTHQDTGLTIKVGGTSYARRIIDLHRSNPFLKGYEETIPQSWLSPDEIESPHTYTRQRDIWHVGLLLVRLLFGLNCLHTYRDLATLVQRAPGISEYMSELLQGLLTRPIKKRWTAEEALSHLEEEVDVTRKTVNVNNSFSSSIPLPSPQDLLGTSPNRALFLPGYQSAEHNLNRYRATFDEVDFLGKGGFGEVVKAVHKLDKSFYAIKKIKVRREDDMNKVLREADNMSKVSHQYVVRYYTVWDEPVPLPERDDQISAATTPTTGLPSDPPSEENIFDMNYEDDLSVSRRDRSRSASFPRIWFGNSGDSDGAEPVDSTEDDDDSSDASTIADSADPRGRPTKAVAIPPRVSESFVSTTTEDEGSQQIIYIQMEFVENKTLREYISSGISQEEGWRLLTQILQALKHMHALGIVHRDLKPSNILLDTSYNVKIADFGLSTMNINPLEIDANTTQALLQEDVDRTSNIGTGFYIAPEVSISRSYNEKADMYSLGIMFFEMCLKFPTTMERNAVLTALRKPSPVFPTSWPGDMSDQKLLIASLLSHDPSQRPKAAQLLVSPLIPSPERQQEHYDSFIREITNPRSSHYTSLLSSLFEKDGYSYAIDSQLADYTYDNASEIGDQLQVWKTGILRSLISLLERHGAVETRLPLFIPETTLLSVFPNLTPVRVLDDGGRIVQLPSGGLVAMGRQASRRGIERIKRYSVGSRYADHVAGGQPRVIGDLCFDIVSPLRSNVAEAELLDVMDKIVLEFRAMQGTGQNEYELHISHETVLATILASVSEKGRLGIRKLFGEIEAGDISSNARNIAKDIAGLQRISAENLEQLYHASDFGLTRSRIEALFPTHRKNLSVALDEMEDIIKLARACGVERKILFRPSMIRNSELFRGGFMFECVRGKPKELIAFGGRYDSLLEHFKEPSQTIQSRKVYGVGLSIAVDRISMLVSRYENDLADKLIRKEKDEEKSFGYWSPARCDVYIAAVAQVALPMRLAIAGELWRAGLKADLQYDDGRALEELQRECEEQNTLFLVIPRANRPEVKVKSVLHKSEEEVPRAELVNYLRQAIFDQRRIDATYGSTEGLLPVASSLNTSTSGAPGVREDDIKLVLPPEPTGIMGKNPKGKTTRKYRHPTKNVYYDKAKDFVESSKSSIPLLGVDLPLPLLSQLTLDTAWTTDVEAWKAILGGMKPGERGYAESVRDAVRDGRAKTGGSMWLFSVREARGFLLQYGKV